MDKQLPPPATSGPRVSSCLQDHLWATSAQRPRASIPGQQTRLLLSYLHISVNSKAKLVCQGHAHIHKTPTQPRRLLQTRRCLQLHLCRALKRLQYRQPSSLPPRRLVKLTHESPAPDWAAHMHPQAHLTYAPHLCTPHQHSPSTLLISPPRPGVSYSPPCRAGSVLGNYPSQISRFGEDKHSGPATCGLWPTAPL